MVVKSAIVSNISTVYTHQCAYSAGVVGYGVDVVSVPVEIGDGAVVMTRIQHNQVKEGPNGERTPDAEVSKQWVVGSASVSDISHGLHP